MEEELLNLEDDEIATISRHRSPTFSKEEVQLLIDLVNKYKKIILNKATNNSVNYTKALAWEKIAKMFNSHGFQYSRSIDGLKMKWDNLKRDARKLSKNVIDSKSSELTDVNGQIVTMICEVENNSSAMEIEKDSIDELTDPPTQNESTDDHSISMKKDSWDGCEDDLDDIDGENDNSRNRSLNFTPHECSLLLQCVREEKKLVFSKETTAKLNKQKKRAWSRITESFNKRSPQKRPTKVLFTKFNNMKRQATRAGIKRFFEQSGKHEKLVEDNEIKSEPMYGDCEDSCDESETRHSSDGCLTNDPLSTVLTADSGIGLMSDSNLTWRESENKEVVKLKLQLLNYQMETAKLERKRLEYAMEGDAAERESRALERSLRVRAARLAAAAGELRLARAATASTPSPSAAPPPEEALAIAYLSRTARSETI